MSYNCNDSFCKDGNCSGCKDGDVWCDDPSCAPFCSSTCIKPNNNSVFLFVSIVFFLIFGIIIMIAYYNNI